MLDGMTKETLDTAINSGRPFVITMADGKEYPVPHRDFIIISPRGSTAIVFDDDDRSQYLPLLTMTGVQIDAPVNTKSD